MCVLPHGGDGEPVFIDTYSVEPGKNYFIIQKTHRALHLCTLQTQIYLCFDLDRAFKVFQWNRITTNFILISNNLTY